MDWIEVTCVDDDDDTSTFSATLQVVHIISIYPFAGTRSKCCLRDIRGMRFFVTDDYEDVKSRIGLGPLL